MHRHKIITKILIFVLAKSTDERALYMHAEKKILSVRI